MNNYGCAKWRKWIAWLFAAFAYCAASFHVHASSSIKILLRYDDYSRSSNKEVEEKLFDLVDRHKISVLVGVVPFPGVPWSQAHEIDATSCAGNEQFDLIRRYVDRGAVEAAVHGFGHLNNKLRGDMPSEFSGLPVEIQMAMLTKGKGCIDAGIAKTSYFIPPFNTYDVNTLHAMEASGYDLLSAGAGPVMSGLRYLPGGPHPHKLRSVIKAALAASDVDGIVVSTMHPYDFVEGKESLPLFRAKSKAENAQIGILDFGADIEFLQGQKYIGFVSIEDLIDRKEDLSERRIIENDRMRVNVVNKFRLLPDRFGAYPVEGVLYSLGSASQMYRLQVALCILFYSIISIVSFAFAWLLCWVMSSKVANLVVSLGLVMVAVAAMKLFLGEFYMRASCKTLQATAN